MRRRVRMASTTPSLRQVPPLLLRSRVHREPAPGADGRDVVPSISLRDPLETDSALTARIQALPGTRHTLSPMHALAALPAVVPALGPKWMDPTYLLEQYGAAFFWIAVAIVFIECGLLFPILPGDSLLFAVGLFIATGQVHVNLGVAIVILCAAAFLGNVVGYEIGRAIGTPLYERDGRILKKKYFDETTTFFDKHGNKALVIGRFVPIVRTFITVVAGVSRMDRRRFFTWSAVGAVLWAAGLTLLGYFLGQAFPWLTDKARDRGPAHRRRLRRADGLRVRQAPPPGQGHRGRDGRRRRRHRRRRDG